MQWQNQANNLKRNVTSKPLCITNIEMIEGNLVDCEHTQNVQIEHTSGIPFCFEIRLPVKFSMEKVL